jgi:hypothetical protein
MLIKTVLILANSVKKRPGRCIAGREIVLAGEHTYFGPWIRPVSPDGQATEGELLPMRHCLTHGSVPIDLLSIFNIPLARKRTDHGQPENWDVVTGVPWKRISPPSRRHLARLIEHPPHLWDVGAPGARRVHVSAPLEERGKSSLTLIRPSNFRIWVQRSHTLRNDHEKTIMRGVFAYAGRDYEFDITDDSFAPHIRVNAGHDRTDHRSPFGDDCLLCVSLGAPFHDYHYKLIASVIPFEAPTPEPRVAPDEIPF